ncbi:MAG: YggT family protein [Nitrospirae bacterium]|nr:MAG: YggT family protein [Nitrospirota bacterium]
MFIIANLFYAIAFVLDYALDIYKWIVIIAALISWVNPDPYNPIVRFLYAITEPVFRRVRRFLNLNIGIDISPIIVILGIVFIQIFVVRSLFHLSTMLRSSGL